MDGKNKDYIDARDMLIPVADRFANDKSGTSRAPGEVRADWARRWSMTFLTKMDELAREQGLIT